MKSYITDEKKNGKFNLAYQVEGMNSDISSIKKLINNTCVVAYGLPKKQSLSCAWELRLYLNNNILIDFTSTCTEIVDWEEMGSLNMRFSSYIDLENNLNEKIYTQVKIEDFCIKDIKCLFFEDDKVYSECGIVFINSNKDEIIIAAGIPAGSVSMKADFSKEKFEPELGYEDYVRKNLQ